MSVSVHSWGWGAGKKAIAFWGWVNRLFISSRQRVGILDTERRVATLDIRRRVGIVNIEGRVGKMS